MQKRVDYIIEERRNNRSSQSSANTSGTADTMVAAYAAAVASGQMMQTHAHSLGLLFEQSVTQQNNHFLMANSNNVVQATNLLSDSSKALQQILSYTSPSKEEPPGIEIIDPLIT